MTRKFHFFCLKISVFLLVTALPAFAVQEHGAAEGLISHEIGHILFITGMGYLLTRIRVLNIKGPGWFEFKIFLCLIIAWNVLTLVGHWMNVFIPKSNFTRSGGIIKTFNISGFADLYYYLSRLDHILLVPAFVFLLLALIKWGKQK